MKSKRHLSPEEFADVTGMSVKTVRRRLKAGKLPANQSGGKGTLWRINYEAFLKGHTSETSNTESLLQQPTSMPNQNSCEETIPGPRPMWMSGRRKSNFKRGYGPKKK